MSAEDAAKWIFMSLTTDPDGILHSWLTNKFDDDAARASMLADFDRWT